MGFIFLLLLLGLANPVLVRAETTVYVLSRPFEVPSPVMLLVAGLALIAVSSFIRRWFKAAPAPDPDDVNVTGPIPEFASAMLDMPVVEGEHAEQDRLETSRPAA